MLPAVSSLQLCSEHNAAVSHSVGIVGLGNVIGPANANHSENKDQQGYIFFSIEKKQFTS